MINYFHPPSPPINLHLVRSWRQPRGSYVIPDVIYDQEGEQQGEDISYYEEHANMYQVPGIYLVPPINCFL